MTNRRGLKSIFRTSKLAAAKLNIPSFNILPSTSEYITYYTSKLLSTLSILRLLLTVGSFRNFLISTNPAFPNFINLLSSSADNVRRVSFWMKRIWNDDRYGLKIDTRLLPSLFHIASTDGNRFPNGVIHPFQPFWISISLRKSIHAGQSVFWIVFFSILTISI